jgi:putative SOS response-associated peptidase YedK
MTLGKHDGELTHCGLLRIDLGLLGSSHTDGPTITTEANRQLSTIQSRMPVIIEPADWPI